MGDNLRTPFTGGAEAHNGGTDWQGARLWVGKFWKYRAVSAGCARKFFGAVWWFCLWGSFGAPTLFDIVMTLKRYEGGLVLSMNKHLHIGS